MSHDSSSLAYTPGRDITPCSDLSGSVLCQEVMSILEEASFIGEGISIERLLNAVHLFGSQNGYAVSWKPGTRKITTKFVVGLSLMMATPSPK